MIKLFQQRDFGDKINATFQYVSQNFRSLGLALLYIVGPVAVLAEARRPMVRQIVVILGKAC